LPIGWNSIEAKKPKFVVFGETHGTQESPELVESVACALATRGERILVAIELESRSNPHLQKLWRTPSNSFARAVLAELPGFAQRQDGVASRAMLTMLDHLQSLSRNRSIDVVAFNSVRDAAQAARWRDLPGQGAHEAAQAENIAMASARKRYDRVLVLVGNLHAGKDRSMAVDFEPMAMRLARVGPLISLVQTYATGTAWYCMVKRGATLTPANIDCGAHGTQGASPDRPVEVRLWSPGDPEANSAYDGYYWFPVVHASPPAGLERTKQ
jgi:hypothetical protein